MNIGYARVSTEDQSLDLQLDALTAHGCECLYEEHASGKNADRPELDQVLKALRPGDTLTVWRLDRLGRNLADLVRIVNDLEGRGVGFVSLTEQINTTSQDNCLPSVWRSDLHVRRHRDSCCSVKIRAAHVATLYSCRRSTEPPPSGSRTGSSSHRAAS